MSGSGRATEPGRSTGEPPDGTAATVATSIAPDAASVTGVTWRPSLPALVVGAVCIVAGGLVAAVTGPLALAHGSWAAAYLVLVAGVAQVALAGGQAILSRWPRHPSGHALLLVEFAGWNVGNAAVIIGTLWGATWLVNLGGALLVVALGALFVATHGGFGPGDVARGRRVALLTVRGLVALLLVSIPIGLWLAHARAH